MSLSETYQVHGFEVVQCVNRLYTAENSGVDQSPVDRIG